MDRLISPLLGPIRRLSAARYDASSPSLFTLLPELTDIHRRVGLSSTPQYHLGGFGFSLEEALMRALGESIERASHITFHTSFSHLIQRHRQKDLVNAGIPHLSVYELGRFKPEQREHPRFIFHTPSEEVELVWVPSIDLRSDKETLLPLQAATTGFHDVNEARLTLGVSTGTAAHTSYGQALHNALLELLQLDATMGHWYSNSAAPIIDTSASSTPRFAQFLKMYAPWLDRSGVQIEFYWLRRPDDGIPVYVVACLCRRAEGFPALTAGLGIATDLEQAMYSAIYETIPISYGTMLSALSQLYEYAEPVAHQMKRSANNLYEAYQQVDSSSIIDLDTALGYYALPTNAATIVPSRFDPRQVVTGPEIRRQVPQLQRSATQTITGQLLSLAIERYRIFALDLSAEDAVSLGFRVVRLFSPDLLSLYAPSFPEGDHPRFEAYGGFRSAAPHPYP
jgi:thiazole/oxazole-forming peptide maturase SagD family component